MFNELMDQSVEVAITRFEQIQTKYAEFFDSPKTKEELEAVQTLATDILGKFSEIADLMISYGERFQAKKT